MAETGSDPLGFRLDIKQILLEAQHRWLRPAEICEILRNYRKFHITPEPLYKPVSGSVFLFDRKVLRYFRKDGHNWRKKKDGKTVKEAHEKLKVGSVDMLHCYYAHGEDNENFQRRSYWMLEPELMHIVFVHYLEVKGNKSMRSIEPCESNSVDESSLSVGSAGNCSKLTSTSADSPSPTSTLTSAYEDVESEYSHPGTSGLQSFPELTATAGGYSVGNMDTVPLQYPVGSQHTLDLASWEQFLENCTKDDIAYRQDSTDPSSVQTNWQYYSEGPASQFHGQPVQQSFISDPNYDFGRFSYQKTAPEYFQNTMGISNVYPNETAEIPVELNHQFNPSFDNSEQRVGNQEYSIKKHPLLDGHGVKEGLNKVDSFSRWVAKELGDVEELQMHSSNGIPWTAIESEDSDSCLPSDLQLGSDSLNPSLSQEQLFSIMDFSPSWAYSNLKTKVLITGTFLRSEKELVECKWSCMFGEVEVPVEVFPNGLLCCCSPPHKAGTVPFYITCSNRLACSEIREFEYRAGPSHATEVHLHERFERLLHLGPPTNQCSPEDSTEKQAIVNKLIAMMDEENLCITDFMDLYEPKNRELSLSEKQLKERLYTWLLHRISEDGKGPAILDEGGQGILHLAAALGYIWALKPILISGVSVDFRDVSGWTPLHWAAFYGREETVTTLVSLGASPGPVTDPSAEYPLGRTPADLASTNGHKGISGFLAESSLAKQLATLDVTDSKENNALDTSKAEQIQTVTVHNSFPTTDNATDVSLKDSLAAVRNATQAAARIHQIFRVQSFQRKRLVEQGGDSLSSDEQAISMLASKPSRLGQNDRIAHSAATQIQKKFRGWKKRKEFLIIRQRVVKIQAHVRGHQARKKYKPIIWSVGILEKVILRWRRKGSGLRGFRSDAVPKPIMEDSTSASADDDYDFLKEGRKQTEERMQKALARVKSMAQNPEARAQYQRMIAAAEGLSESRDADTRIAKTHEDTVYPDEELLDIDSLLDDETLMSIAFE